MCYEKPMPIKITEDWREVFLFHDIITS